MSSYYTALLRLCVLKTKDRTIMASNEMMIFLSSNLVHRVKKRSLERCILNWSKIPSSAGP